MDIENIIEFNQTIYDYELIETDLTKKQLDFLINYYDYDNVEELYKITKEEAKEIIAKIIDSWEDETRDW